MLSIFHARAKNIVKWIGNHAHIFGRKCKIATFGYTIFPENVSYKLQFTRYLYNAAN